jgi:hypothetical protein
MKITSHVSVDAVRFYCGKQVFMLASLIFSERARTNLHARLLWPLVATGPGEITEYPLLF